MKKTTKNKKNIFSKKDAWKSIIFISASVGTLVTISCAPLVSGSSTSIGNKYSLDNITFSNKEDLIQYAQEKYFVRNNSNLNRYKWSVNAGNEVKYFNDPKLLNEFLLSFIDQHSVFSSSEIKVNNLGDSAYNDISQQSLSKLYQTNDISSISKKIYRGKNNSIHLSEAEAKDSYLSMHDAYYFNNLYFKNLEDLKLYLETVYFVNSSAPGFVENTKKKIGIKAPKGLVSAGIDNDALFKQGDSTISEQGVAKNLFENFIKSNANEYLEIADGTKTKYISKDDI